MDCYRIVGGRPLRGRVVASGSKNASLVLLAATILLDGPARLRGIPRVADTRAMVAILRRLGMRVSGRRGSLAIEPLDPTPVRLEQRLGRRLRASFCVLGPLLARRGRAVVPLPGGCNLGDRPVDLHLRGLAALGADIRLEHGYVIARADRLRGASILMRGPRGPSVTGTANVLMAACLARGRTRLCGAAREPEIVELGRFLIACGAQITGLGDETIEIEGVERLGRPLPWRVMPDRIEAATWLLYAAATRGRVSVRGAVAEHLGEVLRVLRAIGCDVTVSGDEVTLAADREPLSPLDVATGPYPAMPTDLQPLWLALAGTLGDSSRVVETIFPGRFQHVGELRRFGARIDLAFLLGRCVAPVRGGSAIGAGDGVSGDGRGDAPAPGAMMAAIDGPTAFSGAEVEASDLRAGAALVLAGLAASGETVIHGAHHLDRGYHRLCEKLRGLGACVERRRSATSHLVGDGAEPCPRGDLPSLS